MVMEMEMSYRARAPPKPSCASPFACGSHEGATLRITDVTICIDRALTGMISPCCADGKSTTRFRTHGRLRHDIPPQPRPGRRADTHSRRYTRRERGSPSPAPIPRARDILRGPLRETLPADEASIWFPAARRWSGPCGCASPVARQISHRPPPSPHPRSTLTISTLSILPRCCLPSLHVSKSVGDAGGTGRMRREGRRRDLQAREDLT